MADSAYELTKFERDTELKDNFALSHQFDKSDIKFKENFNGTNYLHPFDHIGSIKLYTYIGIDGVYVIHYQNTFNEQGEELAKIPITNATHVKIIQSKQNVIIAIQIEDREIQFYSIYGKLLFSKEVENIIRFEASQSLSKRIVVQTSDKLFTLNYNKDESVICDHGVKNFIISRKGLICYIDSNDEIVIFEPKSGTTLRNGITAHPNTKFIKVTYDNILYIAYHQPRSPDIIMEFYEIDGKLELLCRHVVGFYADKEETDHSEDPLYSYQSDEMSFITLINPLTNSFVLFYRNCEKEKFLLYFPGDILLKFPEPSPQFSANRCCIKFVDAVYDSEEEHFWHAMEMVNYADSRIKHFEFKLLADDDYTPPFEEENPQNIQQYELNELSYFEELIDKIQYKKLIRALKNIQNMWGVFGGPVFYNFKSSVKLLMGRKFDIREPDIISCKKLAVCGDNVYIVIINDTNRFTLFDMSSKRQQLKQYMKEEERTDLIEIFSSGKDPSEFFFQTDDEVLRVDATSLRYKKIVYDQDNDDLFIEQFEFDTCPIKSIECTQTDELVLSKKIIVKRSPEENMKFFTVSDDSTVAAIGSDNDIRVYCFADKHAKPICVIDEFSEIQFSVFVGDGNENFIVFFSDSTLFVRDFNGFVLNHRELPENMFRSIDKANSNALSYPFLYISFMKGDFIIVTRYNIVSNEFCVMTDNRVFQNIETADFNCFSQFIDFTLFGTNSLSLIESDCSVSFFRPFEYIVSTCLIADRNIMAFGQSNFIMSVTGSGTDTCNLAFFRGSEFITYVSMSITENTVFIPDPNTDFVFVIDSSEAGVVVSVIYVDMKEDNSFDIVHYVPNESVPIDVDIDSINLVTFEDSVYITGIDSKGTLVAYRTPVINENYGQYAAEEDEVEQNEETENEETENEETENEETENEKTENDIDSINLINENYGQNAAEENEIEQNEETQSYDESSDDELFSDNKNTARTRRGVHSCYDSKSAMKSKPIIIELGGPQLAKVPVVKKESVHKPTTQNAKSARDRARRYGK